ncbi:MAG: serine hydrolase [Scytonema hyalinum WJT4-NPBG1]|jgi:CubicO group peptidase (beta-lactamase class C family)|nr:serine hydrolase [Scytonema hyalinum WJT4-NPBG1]
MKLFVLLLIVILFIAAVSIQLLFASESIPSNTEIQAILQQRIDKEKQSVGIVVGLINPKGSRIVSYGNLNQTSSRQPDGDTVFEIGSISKVFTSLLLADMVERKELSLKDPISKFLPKSVKVPTTKDREITVQDLATHTSGLPKLPNNFESKDIENPYADYTVEQLYSFLSNYQLTREIGAEYEYSNVGAGLLGHILSLKAGIDYENLITTRICQPLKMDSTRIKLSPEMQARFATGHNQLGQPVKNWDIPTLAGAGALRSTANDLLKFLAANLDFSKSNLSPAIQRTHVVEHDTNSSDLKIGLGWHILKKYGKEIIWHNGGTGGYHSFIGFDKNKRLGVVVLSNSVNDIDDIGLHLLEPKFELAKRTPPKEHKPIVLDPKIYDAYIGQYQLAPNFLLTISKEQDKLYAQATGQARLELFAESETEFFIKEVDAQITFVKNEKGQVTHLILHQNRQNLEAKKIQ